VLDAELRAADRSLVSWLGADRRAVPCGVSIGIADSTDELRALVDEHLEQGYLRIKLKIMPGIDVERVTAIRRDHPDILLSVDANAAYTLDDADTFRALDELDLLMIEQPLHYEDLVRHAALQAQIRTPICLDESIRSSADAAAAMELGACRIINIKQGRVGGVLETGIGRATNLALAALPNFALPGDTSASARYFAEDLTEPFVLDADGTMAVPDGPGIGVEPRPDRLEACTVRREIVTAA
jgi:O-succinylbenzoate synthase